MFVRWSSRTRVRREIEPNPLIRAVLAKSVRIGGRPRQEVVGYLASIRSHGLKPESIGSRIRFWNAATARLDKLALSADERQKVEAALAARVPTPTPEERGAAMRQSVEQAQANAPNDAAASEAFVPVSISDLKAIKSELERLHQRDAAVIRLQQGIREALAVAPKDRSPEAERMRYSGALIPVVDFLKDEVRDPICAEGIASIYDLFRGIDRGEDAPVLRPLNREDVKGGQRPTRELVLRDQGDAAINYEALVRAGKGKKEAAEYLAKHFPGLERLMSGKGKSLSGSIRYWAKEMASRSPKKGWAVGAYQKGLRIALSRVDALPQDTRLRETERLVARWLARFAGS